MDYIAKVNEADIICIQESWTNPTDQNSDICSSKFGIISRIDKNTSTGRSGGAIVMAKHGVIVEEFGQKFPTVASYCNIAAL